MAYKSLSGGHLTGAVPAIGYRHRANDLLFLIIVRGVFLEGNSYELLMDQYWPTLIIGIVSLIFSGWLFKHRMY